MRRSWDFCLQDIDVIALAGTVEPAGLLATAENVILDLAGLTIAIQPGLATDASS